MSLSFKATHRREWYCPPENSEMDYLRNCINTVVSSKHLTSETRNALRGLRTSVAREKSEASNLLEQARQHYYSVRYILDRLDPEQCDSRMLQQLRAECNRARCLKAYHENNVHLNNKAKDK
jgi:hypothetical protein